MLEESPFTPGRPVDVTEFSGRNDLVKKLVDTAKSTSRGRFNIAYISGERGIGKSSLAHMACHIAERDLYMATAYTPLGGIDDLLGLARRVLLSLAQSSVNKPWMDSMMAAFGKYIKAAGLFGVNFELNMPQPDLQAIVDNFAEKMRELLDKIGDDRKGLILVLDDINGLAEQASFAHWLKSMIDGVAVSGQKDPPVFLLLAGLEERHQQMISHNPSVARIFQPTLFVEPWTPEETRIFFHEGFKKGGLELSEESLEQCVSFSGGLPMLAQEIGHAVWTRAKKGASDPLQGINDAAEAIGRQYLKSSVVQALHSNHYRAILKKIGSNLSIRDTFSKRELREKIDLSADEQKALDNFINRMRKLEAILPDQESGERGVYRFPSQLHRLYFKLVAIDMKQQKKSANE